MTQFQHTLRQLLTGEKTETSRIALPETEGTGEYDCEMIGYPLGIPSVQRYLPGWDKWRTVWETGKDYAIQPARGVHSVGRYRVEAIWRQDVRTLNAEQVSAEGFRRYFEFIGVWQKMHDRKAHDAVTGGQVYEVHLYDFIQQQPAERYQAWRMTIKVLWETVDWEAPAVCALQIEPKLS